MVLSNKILQFNFRFKAFVAYIAINYVELGIPLAQKTDYPLTGPIGGLLWMPTPTQTPTIQLPLAR